MQPLGARSLLLAYLLSATTIAYPSPRPAEVDSSAFTCLGGDYDDPESCRVGCGEGQGLGNCNAIEPVTTKSLRRDLSIVKSGAGPKYRCECDS